MTLQTTYGINDYFGITTPSAFESNEHWENCLPLKDATTASEPVQRLLDRQENVLEMTHGQQFRGLPFLVGSYETRESQTGAKWLDVVLQNVYGSTKSKIWLNGSADEYIETLESGSLFLVDGKMEIYRGNKGIVISRISPVDCESPELFLKGLPEGETVKEYRDELIHYLSSMSIPFQRVAFIVMKNYWNEFSVRPAALKMHHAHIHGLLKHTTCLMRLADYILQGSLENPKEHARHLLSKFKEYADIEVSRRLDEGDFHFYQIFELDHMTKVFQSMFPVADNDSEYENPLIDLSPEETPSFDRDVTLLSILLHDIGKIWEYTHVGDNPKKFASLFPHVDEGDTSSRGISMDDRGKLIGHMPIGVLVFQNALFAAKGCLSLEQSIQVTHNILSHHGKKEWDSSVVPASPQAWLIHFVDNLDAKYESYQITIR